MSHRSKIWIIIGVLLVVAGIILFVAAMTTIHWDISNLIASKYVTSTYTINGNLKDISIATDTADVIFRPSENGERELIFHERKNMTHSVTEENGMLSIKVIDNRNWYEYIGINLSTPQITVHIPQDEYASLSIKGSTGDVEIPNEFKFDSIDISTSTGSVKCGASAQGLIKINATTGHIDISEISAGDIDISLSTGDIILSSVSCNGNIKLKVTTGDTVIRDLKCNDLVSNGSTGDLTLKNVILSGSLYAERSTGDVTFDRCDAAELFIETDTGNVNGSLLSEKIFIVETDTGSKNVPKTITGGRCEIETETGDIRIGIVE